MKGFAKLALRIFGLYLFIEFLMMLPYLPSTFSMMTENQYLIFFAPSLLLVISVLLWVFSEKLALFMTRKDKFQKFSNIDMKKLQSVAFSVLGMIIIATALPDLINIISSYFIDPEISLLSFTLNGESHIMWSKILDPTTKLLIGFVLLLFSNNIASVLPKYKK